MIMARTRQQKNGLDKRAISAETTQELKIRKDPVFEQIITYLEERTAQRKEIIRRLTAPELDEKNARKLAADLIELCQCTVGVKSGMPRAVYLYEHLIGLAWNIPVRPSMQRVEINRTARQDIEKFAVNCMFEGLTNTAKDLKKIIGEYNDDRYLPETREHMLNMMIAFCNRLAPNELQSIWHNELNPMKLRIYTAEKIIKQNCKLDELEQTLRDPKELNEIRIMAGERMIDICYRLPDYGRLGKLKTMAGIPLKINSAAAEILMICEETTADSLPNVED